MNRIAKDPSKCEGKKFGKLIDSAELLSLL